MDLYYFDEGYYTPELGYFEYTARAASALTSTATLAAAPGTIKQFFERAVTGITVDGTHHVEYQDAALTGAWSNQTVISMWVRKHRSTSEGTLLHNRNRFPGFSDIDQASVGIGPTGTITLSVGNQTSNFGGLNANYGLSWADAVTTDTEWHHVVLDCVTWNAQQSQPAITWQLYVDGVSKGTRSVGEGAYVNARGTFQNWISRVELGTGFNGHLAQVWGGDRATFALSEFYDNGFVANLPSGNKIYSLLDHPYDATIIGKNYSDRNNTTTIALDDGTFKNGERVQGYFIESNLFVDGDITQVVGANLSSAFTQSVSAIKQVGITANLNTTATLSAPIARTRPTAVTLSAFYTELTAVAKIARSPITFTTAFTLTCNALAGKLASANLNSDFTLTVNYIVAKRANAAFSSAFALTAANRRLSETLVPLTVTATQSAVNTRRRQTPVGLNTTATQTVEYLVISQVNANLASSFALVATAKKVAVAAIALNTAFTQTTAPNRIRRTAVTLQGIYAELADGYIIHIDPYLTYLIEQETRNFLITTEARDYVIAQETRARQIPAETRIYAVDSDTRVNTIIGSAL
jgi:hypothetical protein